MINIKVNNRKKKFYRLSWQTLPTLITALHYVRKVVLKKVQASYWGMNRKRNSGGGHLWKAYFPWHIPSPATCMECTGAILFRHGVVSCVVWTSSVHAWRTHGIQWWSYSDSSNCWRGHCVGPPGWCDVSEIVGVAHNILGADLWWLNRIVARLERCCHIVGCSVWNRGCA